MPQVDAFSLSMPGPTDSCALDHYPVGSSAYQDSAVDKW